MENQLHLDHAAGEDALAHGAFLGDQALVGEGVRGLAIAAADALELGAGGLARELEEVCLVGGARHAREGADLGIGELAPREGFIQERQGAEGTGDAHLLASGRGVEADSPGEPVGAGDGPLLRPTLRLVEGAHAGEQVVSGGIEVRGQFRTLVSQSLDGIHLPILNKCPVRLNEKSRNCSNPPPRFVPAALPTRSGSQRWWATPATARTSPTPASSTSSRRTACNCCRRYHRCIAGCSRRPDCRSWVVRVAGAQTGVGLLNGRRRRRWSSR